MNTIDRIAELHTPVDEEAEFWYGDIAGHGERFPDCLSEAACTGHTLTVQVCRECGYGHDDGLRVFRPWPCPTRILCDEAGDVTLDEVMERFGVTLGELMAMADDDDDVLVADRDRWKADAERLTDAARKTVSGLSDAYPRGGMWPDPERESIRQQDAGALSAALSAHDALTAETGEQ